MFQEACDVYSACKATVGADGAYFGCGCFISPRHVLTAYDLVEKPVQDGRNLEVLWRAGTFKAAPKFLEAASGLALLEVNDAIQAKGKPASKYPLLSKNLPKLGAQVGYLAWWRMSLNQRDTQDTPYFGESFVSGYVDKICPKFLLSTGFVQKGFEGSPAFDSEGHLLGVIVQVIEQLAQGIELPSLPHRFPVMSPIAFRFKALDESLR